MDILYLEIINCLIKENEKNKTVLSFIYIFFQVLNYTQVALAHSEFKTILDLNPEIKKMKLKQCIKTSD